MTALLLALIGAVAGLLGALLGVGGGIVVIPALTLLLAVPFRHAVAVSLVVIVASSSAAAASYVERRLADVRVGVVLELGSVSGALLGSWLAARIPAAALQVGFAAVALWLAAVLLLRRRAADERPDGPEGYRVRGWWIGLPVSAVAGAVSGLLGVGGGFLKVPAMNLAMGLPFKVAAATSSFMIGVTAAASAYAYYARGELDAALAAPVVVGVFAGARAGAGILPRVPASRLKATFALLLLFVGGRMMWAALGGAR